MAKSLERMVLHDRIELSTSPLPRQMAAVQALLLLAFSAAKRATDGGLCRVYGATGTVFQSELRDGLEAPTP